MNLQVVGKFRIPSFHSADSHCHVGDLRFVFLSSRSFSTVPPKEILINNGQNEPIESRAGPYEESGQLILTCDVIGGKTIQRQHSLKAKISCYGKDFISPTLRSKPVSRQASDKNPVRFDLYHQK